MDTILLCLYRLRTQVYSHRSKTGRSWMLLEELGRASDPYPDTEDDRRAYEFCVFSKLRNRLRAGDVWVDRSRQYQDFETDLLLEVDPWMASPSASHINAMAGLPSINQHC